MFVQIDMIIFVTGMKTLINVANATSVLQILSWHHGHSRCGSCRRCQIS